MEIFLEKIKSAKGQEIKVVKSTEIMKITDEKRGSYKNGGLRRNECRNNSESVARFLGKGAEVVEGLYITKDNCCFKHMWVKYDNKHIDLTTELFEETENVESYYELTCHKLEPLKILEVPNDLYFSEETTKLLDAYYSENPTCKEKYDKMNKVINEEK